VLARPAFSTNTRGLIAWFPLSLGAKNVAGQSYAQAPILGANTSYRAGIAPNPIFPGVTKDRIALHCPGTSAPANYGANAWNLVPALSFTAWGWLDTNVGNDGSYSCIGGTATGAPNFLGAQMYVRSDLKTAAYAEATATVDYDPGNVTITTKTWNHFAFTYDSVSGLVGYVNGNVDSTAAANGPLNLTDPTHTVFSIGDDALGRFWPGAIDDFRVYNRVLSQPEILAIIAEAYRPDTLMTTVLPAQSSSPSPPPTSLPPSLPFFSTIGRMKSF
jgi:hypothetical protein